MSRFRRASVCGALIRASLTGVDNDMGVIAAGQMLLLYLEALPTPLIGNDVADALVHAIDGRLLEKLPERNLELLEYLTAFIGYKLMRHNKSLTPHMIGTEEVVVCACVVLIFVCSYGAESGGV